MSKYLDVVNWDETNLAALPPENDEYEYKSSVIEQDKSYPKKLKDKIQHAASAFWNSGGGYFIVGVDDNGLIDGGISDKIGRQDIRDWVDNIINSVEPLGEYKVQLIKPMPKSSLIKSGKIVLVIGFAESHNLPHMAPDSRYYIRAGAHSSPARHYIVEAMRARRGANRPVLKGILRRHPNKHNTVELIIMTINNLSAMNVEVSFDPIPPIISKYSKTRSPSYTIPAIDSQNPFRMDMSFAYSVGEMIGKEPVKLILKYQDLMLRSFVEETILDVWGAIGELEIGTDPISKDLSKIAKELESIRKILKK